MIRNKHLALASAMTSLLALPVMAGEVLNIYSHRHYEVDQQINKLFTERTGIEVRVVFPNQDNRGTHVNVSAAGVVKHARNVENARKYLEFLVSPKVQEMLAKGSHEHPVSMHTGFNPHHAKWGDFKIDTTTFPKMGEDQQKALRLFNAAGWK